jgi:hypothetical protein
MHVVILVTGFVLIIGVVLYLGTRPSKKVSSSGGGGGSDQTPKPNIPIEKEAPTPVDVKKEFESVIAASGDWNSGIIGEAMLSPESAVTLPEVTPTPVKKKKSPTKKKVVVNKELKNKK